MKSIKRQQAGPRILALLALSWLVAAASAWFAPIAATAEPYVLGGRLERPGQAEAPKEAGTEAGTKAGTAGQGRAESGSAESAAFKEIDWDSLVPDDWDPMKSFGELDFSQMRDSDPRAIRALAELQDAWKNAPVNAGVDGSRVRIAGFVVPLDNRKGALKEFLLVPYFGACIHVPPPPANQIIHVTASAGRGAKSLQGMKAMDPVWVSGTLTIQRVDTAMGSSGYRMTGDVVTPYAR